MKKTYLLNPFQIKALEKYLQDSPTARDQQLCLAQYYQPASRTKGNS